MASSIGSPTAMLVYKIMNQSIQILNKTVPIAITLHVYVLIAGDERRQSLHTNQLVSIVAAVGSSLFSTDSPEFTRPSLLRGTM